MDRIDLFPQWRVDYANHIATGGLGALVVALALLFGLGMTPLVSCIWAAKGMTALAVGKKLYDFLHEGEDAPQCIGKVIVTVLWPWSIVLMLELAK